MPFQPLDLIQKIIQLGMNHRYNKWSEYEDNILAQLVGKYGNKNWTLISRLIRKNYEIQKRSGKQCRERWISHLDKANQQLNWTLEDDQRLISLQGQLGTRWSEISRCFSGRSDNNIKNRFYSIIRKAIRKMCRAVKIKTTSMNVYTIKPSTLSQVFMLAARSPALPPSCYNSPALAEEGLHQDDYALITNTISYFIFDQYEHSTRTRPQDQRVIEALDKLMRVSSHLTTLALEELHFQESLQETLKPCGSSSNRTAFERYDDGSDIESFHPSPVCQGSLPKCAELEELTLKQGLFSQGETQHVDPLKELYSYPSLTKGTCLYNKMIEEEHGAGFGLFRRETESLIHYNINLDFNLDEPAFFEDLEMRLFSTPRDDFQNFFEKFMD